ncbi:unnamed protein product [Rhodiola kirilowii]
MDESILVSSIIDKLPPAWKDFRRTLKHKKEEMSFEELSTELRIEEELPTSHIFGLEGIKAKRMTLQLADETTRYPARVIENLPLRVDKFYLPCDLVAMDTGSRDDTLLSLGRPFLTTVGFNIDFGSGKLTLNFVGEEQMPRLANLVLVEKAHEQGHNASAAPASVLCSPRAASVSRTRKRGRVTGHFRQVIRKDVDFLKGSVSKGIEWANGALRLPQVSRSISDLIWFRNVEDPKLSTVDLMMADLNALEAYAKYFYYHIKVLSKPLPDVYDPEEVAEYFSYRPQVVALRLLEVFAYFALAGICLRLSNTGKQELAPETDWNVSQYNFGMVLKETMLNLGPTFIKVGQSLSTRPDIIGNEIATALSELHDQIPPFPRTEALKIIEDELGSPAQSFFSYISEEPVAAASFGQVYRASTTDGTCVAVKVQRPNLRHVVVRDIYILRLGLGILQRVLKRNFDPRAYADELGRGFVGELDYNLEADNAINFKEAHSCFPFISVPIIYRNLSNRRVLTMEWIEGESPRDLLIQATGDASDTRSERQLLDARRRLLDLVKKGVEAALIQLLETGLLHGDPHPGNLRYTSSAQFGFLDFGLICRMQRKHQFAMLASVLHIVYGDWASLVYALKDLDVVRPGVNLNNVIMDLEDAIGEVEIKDGIPNVKFSRILGKVWSVAFKYHFRMPPYYTIVLRSLASLEGLAVAADPNFKTFEAAYPYVVSKLLTDNSAATRKILHSDGASLVQAAISKEAVPYRQHFSKAVSSNFLPFPFPRPVSRVDVSFIPRGYLPFSCLARGCCSSPVEVLCVRHDGCTCNGKGANVAYASNVEKCTSDYGVDVSGSMVKIQPYKRRRHSELRSPTANRGSGDLIRSVMTSPGSTTNLLSGTTPLCKALAGVLVCGHVLVQIFPVAVTYLALIPARTIPFAWNLITAGYLEQTIYGAVISSFGLLFLGKLLQPLWGSREFVKFIFFVNFLTSVCIFVTAIALYYITTQEIYLYIPLSGFHGILSGFLVAIKQIMPDHELMKIKAKWFPSIMIILSIAIFFLAPETEKYLPTLIFGTYISWIYCRYLQKKPETNLQGDPSDEFAFSSFFPELLRPVIDPIASVFHKMFCGRFTTSNDTQDYSYGGAPLPGSDPIEASRRRERGARALEERLAAERLATAKSAEDLERDLAANV